MIREQEPEKPRAIPQLGHRYEGIGKVTGKVRYAAEFNEPFPKSELV
jgi:xanthine dehydrogenase YagR molybdenum-binding subunit